MNNNKGFSLLEVLVAFSILAISLGILLNIFSSGVKTAMIAEEYTIATQIAESLMAKTGIEEPFEMGQQSGIEEEKYQWQVRVDNYINTQQEDEEKSKSELMEVRVTVQWGDEESNQRRIELKTVKTGAMEDAEES